MSDQTEETATRREKVDALVDVARYKPKFTAAIVGLGIVAAVLEGVGLSFVLPIVELAGGNASPEEATGLLGAFVTVYDAVGLPFTLGYVVVGVSLVMTVRFSSSFLVGWFREILRTYYTRELQIRAFDSTLDAHVEYFDEEGSDDILNAIVTQTFYAGRVIQRTVKFLEQSFIAAMYLLIAFILAPWLTVAAGCVLGGITILLRHILEPGYKLGDEVADANERRQAAAQAGTQGIRDIRVFGIADELFADFVDAVDKYTRARISLRRNELAIDKFYNLLVAVSIFVMIYVALTIANLPLGELGVFLFAMFRLGPAVSRLNQWFYAIENDLPHLVRTQKFIDSLERREERNEGTRPAPETVEEVTFDDVRFSYDDKEDVLRGISFEVRKGEFVAFVGQSGAGKSTVVSLLTRLYEPDSGEIRVNGVPITDIDVDEWRDCLAVVRQNPYIFDDTLRYNLTIGNRNASQAEVERVCEIAKVDEFLADLPNGYDTQLGDDGVRLSGGQKQRVALARALLEDADLLVLDEATSDLDSNLEQQVQRAIEEMDRDYAIVTVAHRLSTVKNADRIYTVKEGAVAEFGKHDELIERGGKYAELYTIQSRG